MTILLPVISRSVDKVILDYLSQIQHGGLTSTIDGDWNQNNKTSGDENNNNQVEFDDIDDLVGDWANEPWTPCEDVEIPDWAKLQGSKVEEFKDIEDLVWTEDPWTQTPLTDIPAWMRLPGIDFDIPEESSTDSNLEINDETFSDVQEEASTDNTFENIDEKVPDVEENDEDFLAPCVEVKDWAEEKYEQLPLDVPRWALLPGIDYPLRFWYRNSPYWEHKKEKCIRKRIRFGRSVFDRSLPTLFEEKKVYNDHGKTMLYVPTRHGWIWHKVD